MVRLSQWKKCKLENLHLIISCLMLQMNLCMCACVVPIQPSGFRFSFIYPFLYLLIFCLFFVCSAFLPSSSSSFSLHKCMYVLLFASSMKCMEHFICGCLIPDVESFGLQFLFTQLNERDAMMWVIAKNRFRSLCKLIQFQIEYYTRCDELIRVHQIILLTVRCAWIYVCKKW